MRNIYGKQVLETLGELVDPKHTAVLVVDTQDTGHADISCLRPDKDFSMLEEMVPRLTTFIERARWAKTSIVWVVSTPLVKGSAGGSLGYSFPTELSPQHGEMVVRKSRANAFVGTGLDIALRHRNILTTLVTGIATEGCVDATALGAAHHDLYSVVLDDCVASFNRELHQAALAVLRYRCDCVSSSGVLAHWSRAASAA